MTYSTPPGWYPDPGQTDQSPLQERWWDGSVWTDQVRAAAPAWQTQTLAGHPAPARRGRRVAVGVTAGVVALALAGGFYALGRGSGDDTGATASVATPSVPPRPAPPDPGPGQGGRGQGGSGGLGGDAGGLGGLPGLPGGGDAGSGGGDAGGGGGGLPQSEPGFAVDAASGIALPVPDGWKGQSGVTGAGATTGEYPCPGETSQTCVRGGVFTGPAQSLHVTGATAKEAAQQDIGANAKQSYGSGYGKLGAHQQLESGAVTVAGKQGWFVRWKVVTSKGDDGYVESVAFPSPGAAGRMVILRAGFDVNSKAPALSVLDTMIKGIKAAPAGAGGGDGRGV